MSSLATFQYIKECSAMECSSAGVLECWSAGVLRLDNRASRPTSADTSTVDCQVFRGGERGIHSLHIRNMEILSKLLILFNIYM